MYAVSLAFCLHLLYAARRVNGVMAVLNWVLSIMCVRCIYKHDTLCHFMEQQMETSC